MQLKPTWRWVAREKMLLGGYCCEITPEETNRWHLLVHGTVAAEKLESAQAQLKAFPTPNNYAALIDVEKEMFKIGETFYAGVLKDREAQDKKDEAERKKKNDEEEAARVTRLRQLATADKEDTARIARLERDAEARG